MVPICKKILKRPLRFVWMLRPRLTLPLKLWPLLGRIPIGMFCYVGCIQLFSLLCICQTQSSNSRAPRRRMTFNHISTSTVTGMNRYWDHTHITFIRSRSTCWKLGKPLRDYEREQIIFSSPSATITKIFHPVGMEASIAILAMR